MPRSVQPHRSKPFRFRYAAFTGTRRLIESSVTLRFATASASIVRIDPILALPCGGVTHGHILRLGW